MHRPSTAARAAAALIPLLLGALPGGVIRGSPQMEESLHDLLKRVDQLVSRGDYDAARSAAAEAEAAAPDHQAALAAHGYLLLDHDPAGAGSRLAKLQGRPVIATFRHFWLGLAFRLEAWAEVVRVAEAFPAQNDARVRGLMLTALSHLEEDEAFRAAVAELDTADRDAPAVRFALDLFGMRTDPLATLPHLFDLDRAPYGGEKLTSLVAAARRSGRFDQARRAYVARLFEPDTPGGRWSTARVWFDDDRTWRETLERYLAARLEQVPGMLLLGALPDVSARSHKLALGERLIALEGGHQGRLEAIHFDLEASTRPRAERLHTLEAHVEKHRGHQTCHALLAQFLVQDDPERARQLVDRLAREQLDPFTAGDLALARITLDLVEGRWEKADEAIDGFDPPLRQTFQYGFPLALLAAELRFHRGELDAADGVIDRTIAFAPGTDASASALALRWLIQIERGIAPSYREDVVAWRAKAGESARESRSSIVQGILLTQGEVDASWVAKATANHFPESIELVDILARSAESEVDRDALRRLAAGPRPHDFAPRLVNRLVRRWSAADGIEHDS